MIKFIKKRKRQPEKHISPILLKKQLNTKFIGQTIKYIPELDSTNNEAKRNTHFPDGTLFLTDMQTGGKGRLGREWLSEPGTGIYMSLLLFPNLPAEEISQITLIAGIAVCRALGNNSRIKWPNDIVIASKKICGILTESITANDGMSSVICGIGINVNSSSFPEELSDKATSLFMETGKKYSREKKIANVLNEFEMLYEQFINSGFTSLADEYRSFCATLNHEVCAVYQNKTITGTAVDIDELGGLIIKTEDNIITVTAGEVSVRGMFGYV